MMDSRQALVGNGEVADFQAMVGHEVQIFTWTA